MWLLNTDTLKLEAFFNNTPSYAILSHRWEAGQELGFGDVLKTLQHLRGYWKVKEFCAIAQTAGLRYVWADTCCIDQKSSAELSEAINSMFRWYRNADVCYAYLHEIESKEDLGGSTWFSRGWTLQELLAPRKVLFFGHNWIPLGSREHLTSTLERITGIPEDAISNFSYTSYCVAEKMSWSAGRNTTREEDRAYCLLGLFNVNMPLLYGEGPRAYQRLQEEIMKVSTDMSLFLWRGRRSDDSGMLAADTACFSRSSPLLKRSTHTSTAFELVTGWNLNNAGMSVHAKIYPYALADDRSHIFALILNDRSGLGGVYDVFVIFLRKCNTLYGEPTYQRVTVNGSSWNSFGLLLGPCSIDGSPYG